MCGAGSVLSWYTLLHELSSVKSLRCSALSLNDSVIPRDSSVISRDSSVISRKYIVIQPSRDHSRERKYSYQGTGVIQRTVEVKFSYQGRGVVLFSLEIQFKYQGRRVIHLSVKRNSVDIQYIFQIHLLRQRIGKFREQRSDSDFCRDKFQLSTYWRVSVSVELKLSYLGQRVNQ